jgi:hypothetical protein
MSANLAHPWPAHRQLQPAPAPADTNDPDGVNVDRDGSALPAIEPTAPAGRRKAAEPKE